MPLLCFARVYGQCLAQDHGDRSHAKATMLCRWCKIHLQEDIKNASGPLAQLVAVIRDLDLQTAKVRSSKKEGRDGGLWSNLCRYLCASLSISFDELWKTYLSDLPANMLYLLSWVLILLP